MARRAYEVGDRVGYPELALNPGEDGGMTVIDRKIILYKKSKKIFIQYCCDGLIENLAKDIRSNIENEYDNLIVIDGDEGSGKSNLAVHLCKTIDPDWNLEEGYIYNYSEFVEAITNKDQEDRKRIFLMDEGSLVANKRESMSEDSKRFVELLETMRSRGWTLVMCIPSVERLDIYIREHRIRYHLRALEMAWDEVNTTKSRGYFELKFKRGKGLDSFHTIAYGRFPKMDPETRKTYDMLKKKSQERLIQKIAGKEKKNNQDSTKHTYKERIFMAMAHLRDQGMPIDELQKIFGADMSEQNVYSSVSMGRRLIKESEGNGEDKD